jgi:THO complex subunit 4
VNQSNGSSPRKPIVKLESQVRSSKMNLSNLHYRVTDQDLRDLFTEFGKIKSANVFYDKSGRSLGNAQVVFVDSSCAAAAKKKYNGILLDGKFGIVH